MTPGELLLRLRANPDDGASFEGLFKELGRRVARALGEPATSADVEDAAQRCFLKLWERAKVGASLPADEPSATAYVAITAQNAARDVLRERRRDPLRARSLDPHSADGAGVERESVAVGVEGDPEAQLAARELETTIDELRLNAREGRSARYRADFDVQFEDALRLASGDSTADVLGGRPEGLPSGEQALKRARDAVYTAQKRLRLELQSTVEALVSEGRWTDDKADLARTFLRKLLRCQRRPARLV